MKFEAGQFVRIKALPKINGFLHGKVGRILEIDWENFSPNRGSPAKQAFTVESENEFGPKPQTYYLFDTEVEAVSPSEETSLELNRIRSISRKKR